LKQYTLQGSENSYRVGEKNKSSSSAVKPRLEKKKKNLDKKRDTRKGVPFEINPPL